MLADPSCQREQSLTHEMQELAAFEHQDTGENGKKSCAKMAKNQSNTPKRISWPRAASLQGTGAWGAQGLSLLPRPCSMSVPACMSQCLMLQKPPLCVQSPPTQSGIFKGRCRGYFSEQELVGYGIVSGGQEMLLFLPFPELGDDKHRGLPPFSCDPSRRGGWPQRGGEGRSVIV